MKRTEETRESGGPTCGELLLILLALIVGELVWIVLFTYLAVWLRGSP